MWTLVKWVKGVWQLVLEGKKVNISPDCCLAWTGVEEVFSSVQSLSRGWLFATPWTAARQASLSITNSWSLLKLTSIELVSHATISSSVVPFSSCLQSFPASESFPMSQLFTSGDQSIGVSASASVLPVNIQGWFPLGLTGLISLLVQYLEHNRRSVKSMSTWMN